MKPHGQPIDSTEELRLLERDYERLKEELPPAERPAGQTAADVEASIAARNRFSGTALALTRAVLRGALVESSAPRADIPSRIYKLVVLGVQEQGELADGDRRHGLSMRDDELRKEFESDTANMSGREYAARYKKYLQDDNDLLLERDRLGRKHDRFATSGMVEFGLAYAFSDNHFKRVEGRRAIKQALFRYALPLRVANPEDKGLAYLVRTTGRELRRAAVALTASLVLGDSPPKDRDHSIRHRAARWLVLRSGVLNNTPRAEVSAASS